MRVDRSPAGRPARRNILITGASSGIGEGMAHEFAARGRNLALCARRTERLTVLASRLRAAHPDITVVVRELDVNDHDRVFEVFEEFRAELGSLDRIVVNAGLGKGQPIGSGHFAANRETAETNFIAALAQCEAAMGILRRQQAGHLAVVASFAAVRGLPGNVTAYAASKAAAASLADGIRAETAGGPISVTALLPGYIESEMTARAGRTPLLTGAAKGARAMARALEREPARAYIPTLPWAPLSVLMRLLPATALRRFT